MTAPTLEQCHARAKEIDLPLDEAIRFFHYHETSGWVVRKMPMKSWHSAMALWKMNWQKWNQKHSAGERIGTSPMQLMLWKTELDRVEQAIKNVRGGYSENMDLTREDIDKLNGLRQRRKELMGNLGMRI
jgi:hypothetical protein